MVDGIKRLISIIVVNYNAGQFLSNCIESALSQADEIVIVDNASTDNSIDICIQKFQESKKLKYILNNNNKGFAAACNIGLENSKGEIILFLNPDCQLGKDMVARMRDVLDEHEKNGMVGAMLINSDGSEQLGGRRLMPTPWRAFVRAFGLQVFRNIWPKLFQDFNLNEEPIPDRPIEVEAISGACMMVKLSSIIDVGLWDEGYFLHCEDLDLSMRYLNKGWRIYFIPDVRVIHHQGACSNQRPVFVEWHKHKGMTRFYQKYYRQLYPSALMVLISIGVWLHFCIIATSKVLFKTINALNDR